MRPGPSRVLAGPAVPARSVGSRWAEARCGVQPGASRRLTA